MEGPWLDSPTKVKKDKKDRRRQAKPDTTPIVSHGTSKTSPTDKRQAKPDTTPIVSHGKTSPNVSSKDLPTVTPDKSSNVTTGFWSLPKTPTRQAKPDTTPNVSHGSSEATPTASSKTPTLHDIDELWDDDMNDINNIPPGNLLEYLLIKNPKELNPNLAPTRLDLIRFKMNLVEALSKCEGEIGHTGGHAHLVMNEAEYQRWVSDPNASIPTKPVILPRPTNRADMTASVVYFIKKDETALALYKEYEKQTKQAIETKFPNGSIGLRDYTGKVPINTTAYALLENITAKVKDDMEDNQLYMEVVQGMLDRTYTPSNDGADIYFQDMDDDQHLLWELGQNTLHYSLLIPKAQEAFHAQHDLKDMTKIASKWKQVNSKVTYIKDSKAYWQAFKAHYQQELKLLYMQMTDKQSKGKARYTADTEWRHNIQDELEATREEIDTFSVALRSIIGEQASYSKQPSTPTTVTIPTASLTTVGSALTPGTQQGPGLEQLTASIIAALQSSNNQPRQQSYGQARTTSEPKPWRQWKQFCWSCGVQLNHNSATCKHQRNGHVVTATYEDQQGGNDRRNHLWEKWCGPDLRIYQKKGDTERLRRSVPNN